MAVEDSATPQIVHVWVCRVKGTEEHVSVRATRDRAEAWIEEQIGGGGEWMTGPSSKRLYRTQTGAETGIMGLCPVPDCTAMIVGEC